MHIIIGLLTGIATILYLLDRIGVDIGWLNPFHWRHRRAWAKRHDGDPIYSVEDPMQIAALLIVGAVKVDGDVSAAQKAAATQQFKDHFSLDGQQASDLYVSAAHLLAAPQLIVNQLQILADKNQSSFSKEQAASMIEMMRESASADGTMSAAQSEFVNDMQSRFSPAEPTGGTWGQ